LRLPFDMSASAEIAALRAAGIPVDLLGNTKSGYLFVRTTGRAEQRTNIFRWFANGIGEAPGLPIGEAPSMPMRTRSEGAPSVF
jgi:hypothetical protein